MKKRTERLIEQLNKSARNVSNAKNPAQREAAGKFLVQRANDLDAEKREIEAWLHEADEYLNTKMPHIAADESHEHNREWVRTLRDYETISRSLNDAWDAYKGTWEAA